MLIIGAFGTHIPITAPSTNSQDYYDYKSFHWLKVQAVYDYHGLFLDVKCGWSGNVYDSKMFVNSGINRKLQNSQLPKTKQCILPRMTPIPNCIIGDLDYPLTQFCIKELDTYSSNEKAVFSNLLSSARNPTECAFGRLKARWSILTRRMDLKLDSISTVIYPCFVLHSFCECHNTYINEDLVKLQIENARRTRKRLMLLTKFTPVIFQGEVVRRTLIEYIKIILPGHLVT